MAQERLSSLRIPSYPFISGNGLKSICRFVFEGEGLQSNPAVNNSFYFIKSDYICDFFQNISLSDKITVVTHNSDINIDTRYAPILNRECLQQWHAMNVNIDHPKIQSIPIGIANGIWEHGNTDILREVMRMNLSKDNLVYANYNIHTNPAERKKCLEATGVELAKSIRFRDYLIATAKSLFTISPNGNGIDCHRHWEALYLRTIPIVTDSINIRFYKHLPFLVLDDWSQFGDISLNRQLYDKIWNEFDISNLFMDKFIDAWGA